MDELLAFGCVVCVGMFALAAAAMNLGRDK